MKKKNNNNKPAVIQKFNIINILNFIFSSKNNFYEFSKKIIFLFFDYKSIIYKNKNFLLLKKKSKPLISFIKKKDIKIAKESIEITSNIEYQGSKIIKEIPYDLGGSGKSVLLYFLTRVYKPNNILETGVAAGFSSYAFLKAIERNKKGFLYSSDLPYFRIKNPIKYIGIVVPKKYKNKWRLYIQGDEINVSKIKTKINSIDFIHYDSDKSYIGRNFFFNSVQNLITKKTLIIIDDLHNNIFFFDYVKKNKIRNYHILKHNNSYVGIILPSS